MRNKLDNKQPFRPGMITGTVTGLLSSSALLVNLFDMGMKSSAYPQSRTFCVLIASLSLGSALGYGMDYGFYRTKNMFLKSKDEDFSENSQSSVKIENKPKYLNHFKPGVGTGMGLSTGFFLGALATLLHAGAGSGLKRTDVFFMMLSTIAGGTTIGLGVDYGRHRLFHPYQPMMIEAKNDELMQPTTLNK